MLKNQKRSIVIATLLTFLTMFQNQSSFALETQSHRGIQPLDVYQSTFEVIDQHGGLGNFTNSQMSQLAEAIDETFTDDPALESTQLGKFIAARSDHLKAFLHIKKRLEVCEKESSKMLSQRVINESSDFSNFDYDCLNYQRQFTALSEFSKNMIEASNVVKNSAYYKDLKEISFENLARTYANIRYSYSSSDKLSGEKMSQELCLEETYILKNEVDICQGKRKAQLNEVIQKELKRLKAFKVKQFSDTETEVSINTKIGLLNEKILSLNKNIGTIERNFWFDKVDYSLEFNDLQLEYSELYMQLANSGPGILMMTDHIKKKMGHIKTSNDISNSSGKFKFEIHGEISQEDVQIGVNEVREKLKDQIHELNKNYTSSNLKSLLKNNPRATSQLLMKSPEYAEKTCELIKEVNNDDQFDATTDKVFLWGGTILGVGLMATGVGALAGAWLLAGSAAGATAVAVGTYVTLAGFAIGVTEGSYWGARSYQNYHEMRNLQSSFLAGGGDQYNIDDNKKALEAFKEARFQSALAFGFSTVDALTAMKIMKIGKLTGVKTRVSRAAERMKNTQMFNRFTNLLKKIAGNKKLSQVFSKIKENLGPKFSSFLAGISKMSALARNSFLTKLSRVPLSRFHDSTSLNLALVDSINHLVKKGLLSQDELAELVSNLNKDIGTKIDIHFEPRHEQYYVTAKKTDFDSNPLELSEELRLTEISDAERFEIISSPQLSSFFVGLGIREQTILAKTVKQFRLKGHDTAEIERRLEKIAIGCK